ncbi:MAG: gamma-glutamylcyclotransferase family protein [Phaeodactylibacter xiamenensis]|uniref:gamma-glutamylcyclotransferase family protein n=1 Tax=Phaeodactylibacter xiamenensis TaxID=1524460 RepID=UPI0009DDC7C4|nr:gamma-glutamylcyclotransferase family protein [Phaeodactylibacter xiamenensis]MCR9054327.1 gamma-glutamylcyclotransferase [bacterium]
MKLSEMRPLFVYGTLLFPEILRLLLGRLPGSSEAVLHGYHRFSIHDGADIRPYPAVFPRAASEVRGLLLYGLSPKEHTVLDAYEGEDYVKTAVSVLQDDQRVEASVYIWRADKRGQLRGVWDPEQFMRQHLGAYLKHMK